MFRDLKIPPTDSNWEESCKRDGKRSHNIIHLVVTEVKTIEVNGVGDRLLVKLLEIVVTDVETCQVIAIADHLLGEAPQ